MNNCTHKNNVDIKVRSRKVTCLAAFVLSTMLVGCNDSDLEVLHAERIAQVQADAGQSTPIPIVSGERESAADIIARSTLVFSDEFNSTTIDSEKWNTQYNWGPDIFIAEEEQYYVDTQTLPDFGYSPFVFDGESLSITADRTPEDMIGVTKGQPYLSGVLTTSGKFDFTYGYAEIRARMPTGVGLSAGFWMLGSVFADLKPTLVIAETSGSVPDSVYHRYNYTDVNDEVIDSGQLESRGSELSSDFHTFGVSWSEDSLTYFVDGNRRHSIAHDNISKQAMYLILNLATGGVFPGSPDETTEFPSDYAIDYVRVYQPN